MKKWIDYRSSYSLNFPRTNNKAFPERATIALSIVERESFLEMALAIPSNPYKLEEQEAFIARAKEIAVRALTKETQRRIRWELDSGFGAVLVRGLPGDTDLLDTPTQGGALEPDYKKTFVCEAALLALGSLTGTEPFNFRQEGRGSAPLIDNIVPIHKLRTLKGAGGYDNNFPFHCESAWHRKRPDYLVLLGIREAPLAKTLVFSTEMINPDSQLLMDSFTERFRLKAPDLYAEMETSGIPMGTRQYVLVQPIQSLATGLRLNINFNGTECSDEAAVVWLSKLETYVEERAVAAVLGPGDALILNNDRTCHTRTGYSPLFDGQDRWFLRGYLKKDLWVTNALPLESLGHDYREQDFEDLVKLGWMTDTGRLTTEFFKYVREPKLAASLSQAEVRLSAIAFFFTPVAGTRIV